MKKSILFAAAAAIAVASSANAQILTEQFNYANGDILTVGAPNWATHSGTAGAATVVASSLSFAGLPTSAGGALTYIQNTNSFDYNRVLSSAVPVGAGARVYASFLLQVTSVSGTGANYSFHFVGDGQLSGGSTRFNSRIGVISDGASGFLLQMVPTSGGTAVNSTSLLLNTTYFIVVRQDIPGATSDAVSVYVNPTPGGAEPGVATISGSGTSFTTVNVTGIAIRQGTGATASVTIDEIRVGTTFASVAPAGASVSDWSTY